MDEEDPESDLNFVLSRQGFFYFHYSLDLTLSSVPSRE